MRAILQTTYGGPAVLSVGERPAPEPRAGEVLVAVRASAVTEGDRRLRAADFPGLGWLPGRMMTGLRRPRHAVPGTAFAGRVAAIGEGVTRFAVGDDVYGLGLRGAYAEYLAIAEEGGIARAPSGLEPAEVAALPYGATTALTFLRDLARVEAGERVAVIGASGEVGRYAVQLARHLGAEVTALCRRDRELVSSLGANRVVDASIEALREAGPFDVVLDTSGAFGFLRCRRAMAPRGRYLSLYMSLGLVALMGVTAMFLGRRAIAGVSISSREDLESVCALVEAGALRPVVARRFELAQAAEAHASFEARQASGSVVIEVAEPVRG